MVIMIWIKMIFLKENMAKDASHGFVQHKDSELHGCIKWANFKRGQPASDELAPFYHISSLRNFNKSF